MTGASRSTRKRTHDERRQAAHEVLLAGVVHAVAAASDLPEAFASFVDIVCVRTPFDSACFVECSPDSEVRVLAMAGSVDWTLLEGHPASELGQLDPQRYRAASSVVVGDNDGEPAEPINRELGRAGVRSYVSVPLVAAREVRALVIFSWSRAWGFAVDAPPGLEDVVSETADAFNMLVLLDRERAAMARLRELDALKNSFVATVVHDLRTPLTVIAGLTHVLLQGANLSDAERSGFLGRIVANTERLSGLVSSVLDISRIESGDAGYDLREFDLRALLGQALEEAGDAEPSRPYRLDAPEQLPLAFGDPDAYLRVVGNLVSNAVKFSPGEAPVEVTITADDSELQVGVRDTGPGIDASDHPRLFQRFSRINGHDPGPRVRGTGLGLYISKQIVEAQGGRIWLESTFGHGATFYFTVPVSRV